VPERAHLRPAAIVAAYAALAVLLTWPTARCLGDPCLLDDGSPFDALIYRWNFAWLADSLAAARSPLATDRLFFPESVSLGLYTPTWLYGLLSLPVQALFPDREGLDVAFHLCVLGSFLVAALATFALACAQGLSRTGAFVAGASFAFCAARLDNVARLNVLGSELVPLGLLALQRTVETAGWRAPLLLAGVGAALAWNSATHLVTFAVGAAAFLPLGPWRRRTPGWALRVGTSGVLAAMLAAPWLASIASASAAVGDLAASRFEQHVNSLGLTWLTWPNAHDWLLGRLAAPVARPVMWTEGPASYFLGLPTLALLVLGLRAGPPALARAGAWACVGIAGWLLALGPELVVAGRRTGIPLPLDWLGGVFPPLRITRAPIRFLVIALVCGRGADRLAARVRVDGLRRLACAGLIAALLVLDTADRLPRRRLDHLEPAPAALGRALAPLAPEAAVLDLPFDEFHVRRLAMYAQPWHGRPILFADYPRAARDNRRHFAGSALLAPLAALGLPPAALETRLRSLDLRGERRRLRALGVGALLLHHDFYAQLLQRKPHHAGLIERGAVLARVLGDAWGAPRRVDLGAYEVLLFRL